MGSIMNGVALHNSGLIPFCATFFVFSDYCRAAIRTSALSKAGVIYVMTHDSVLLGEDGPTHQPIEHLASFRAMPGINTFRPADAVELAACYELAIQRRDAPSLMILSRQKFKCSRGSAEGARRGAYVFSDNTVANECPDLVLIATGSELPLAEAAAYILRQDDVAVRVVSMPCMEVFEEQSKKYRRSVIPRLVPKTRRMVIEAGRNFGWDRYASHFHTIDTFGISAPNKDVAAYFKLTAGDVAYRARTIMVRGDTSDEE